MFLKVFVVFVSFFLVNEPAFAQKKEVELNRRCNLDQTRIYKSQSLVEFINTLKEALKNNEMKEIIKLVHFPLNTGRLGKGQKPEADQKPILNEKEFKKLYHKLISPGTRQKIMRQNINTVFCNTYGVMLGSGEIWVRNIGYKKVKDELKIVTINY